MAQRLNIVINREDQNRLTHLSELMEGASMTEVVKRSLRINEFILSKVALGSVVKIIGPDGKETEVALV